jgi:hypothetical protein
MICIDCVNPTPLKQLITARGLRGDCRYCSNNRLAIATDVLFDHIIQTVLENVATEDDLSPCESGMFFEVGSDELASAYFDVVLAEWAGLGEEPYFGDLYDLAHSKFKVDDRVYFGDNGLLEKNFYEERWDRFIVEIKHSHRFFNQGARNFLDDVFAILTDASSELKPTCIREIEKGVELFRARSAATYEDVKKIAKDPSTQLGPTPKDRASSQRMTPNGISALYCSLERDTCLSEIRAITGDNVVSIAMSPIRSLRLLDLTKLHLVEPPKLTILDRGFRCALHLKSFLGSLVNKMSKPKGRGDDLTYLSTQVVFEYLRLRFGDQVSGLVFPSVQTGTRGTNVVLFPEASVVSTKNYEQLSDYDIAATGEPDFEPDPEEPFEDGASVYCLSGSLRFHKVTAIDTQAATYTQLRELFMSDLDRLRLSSFGI